MNVIDKEIEAIQNTPIVFILGIGRSGTTLLQQSLDAHPNIIAPVESDFILYLSPKFGKIKHWKAKDILQFVEGLFSQPRIPRFWSLNREELTDKLLSIRSVANYPLVCKTVFYMSQKQKDKILMLSNKFPYYSIFAERLLTIFPDAKFIHIVRDPRDNVNSRIKSLLKTNAFMNAWQWVAFNRAIEKDKRRKPGIFFTIKYEEMVKEPEKIFRTLCNFLDVPYNSAMLNRQYGKTLEAFEGTKYYENAKRKHGRLAAPINTSNIGKWKTEMSARDMAITERITAKFAEERYCYKRETKEDDRSIASATKVFLNMLYFYIWMAYTKLRYHSYLYNTYYKGVKLKKRKIK